MNHDSQNSLLCTHFKTIWRELMQSQYNALNTHFWGRWKTFHVHKNSCDPRNSSDLLLKILKNRENMSICALNTYLFKTSNLHTCKSLEVSLAKNSFLLWCLGGEDDLINDTPVVQSVHQTHSFLHLKCSYQRKNFVLWKMSHLSND